MKSFKMAFSMVALMLVAACAGNNGTMTLQPGQVGAGPTGAGVDMKACQVGQVYNTTYGCLSRSTCQQGYGQVVNNLQTLQYPQQQQMQGGQCVAGQIVTEEIKFGTQAGTRHFGPLTIVNKNQFQLLLHFAGVCQSNYYGMTFGFNGFSGMNCQSFVDRGGFIILKAFGGPSNTDTINMTIGAGTQYPYDLISFLPFQYSQQNATNAYMYRSFSQQSRLFTINSNNGMKIVGMGPSGTDVGLVAVAEVGNLGSQTIDVQIMFQGTVVATTQLTKF